MSIGLPFFKGICTKVNEEFWQCHLVNDIGIKNLLVKDI